ncbi:MAG: tetratricopeptide repeat protein [Bryobacteraceae bacterium]|nr:tetratricopeptide repeat protein [Bryobacteraceae bacterium]
MIARKMALAGLASAIVLRGAGCATDLTEAQRLLSVQQLPEALRAVDHCLNLEPQRLGALVLKGNLLYLLSRDTDAMALLAEVVQREPKSAEARYALGRIYYANGRHPQAVEQFEAIVLADPGHFRAWDNLGLALEGVGKVDEAVRAHTRAIALVQKDQPTYDWAYANLAELLMKQDQNRRAFDLAVEAATRNPGSARNCYLAAKALTRLDQWPRAERWLRRSAELDPQYAEPHYLLGQWLTKSGQKEQATEEFARFQKLRGAEPEKRR